MIRREDWEGADDASAVFRSLARVPLPPALLDDLTESVLASLDRPLPQDNPAWRLAALAWAAAAVLAVALAAPLFRGGTAPAPGATPLARAGVTLEGRPHEAQVLDLTVGDTQVVMIFDAGLEL